MFKIHLRKLLDSSFDLERASKTSLPYDISYKFSYWHKQSLIEQKKYNDIFNNLIKEYSDKENGKDMIFINNQTGQIIAPKISNEQKRIEYEQKIKELNETEIMLDYSPIDINIFQTFNFPLGGLLDFITPLKEKIIKEG